MNEVSQNQNVQELIAQAKNILQSSEDPTLKMENLNEIISQVDFLMGKNDRIYGPLGDVFTSMVQMDFTKRVSPNYGDNEFLQFFISGINMINEELEQVALNKEVLHTLLDGLGVKDSMIVITDSTGNIYFVHPGENGLPDFNEELLYGQKIHVLFEDFSFIDNKIKHLGSVRETIIDMKWKGDVIPCHLTLAIAVSMGKINSLVYIFKKL